MEQITRFLELAETLPDPAQQHMLENAARELEHMIEKFDGCMKTGDADKDDYVRVCAEQASLTKVAGDLAIMIGEQLEPEPPEFPPEE